MDNQDYTYERYAKLLHLGMAVFGIAAYTTAELAEGASDSVGFLLHAYLGFSLAGFLGLRWVNGLLGSGPMSFSGWTPFSASQWKLLVEDIGLLMRFKVPYRAMHEGLAGVTQWFGLLIFAWMAITGIALYFLVADAGGELFAIVEELHELGEGLVPLYLLLHVGSVLVHSIAGHSIWKRMWKFGPDKS